MVCERWGRKRERKRGRGARVREAERKIMPESLLSRHFSLVVQSSVSRLYIVTHIKVSLDHIIHSKNNCSNAPPFSVPLN